VTVTTTAERAKVLPTRENRNRKGNRVLPHLGGVRNLGEDSPHVPITSGVAGADTMTAFLLVGRPGPARGEKLICLQHFEIRKGGLLCLGS